MFTILASKLGQDVCRVGHGYELEILSISATFLWSMDQWITVEKILVATNQNFMCQCGKVKIITIKEFLEI